MRPDHVVRQFIRFALVGGSSNIVYAGTFTALAAWGYLVANVVGVVLSTALANELHRRLTFNAAERVSWWSAQWEGGALGLIGLVMSSLTLGVLHVWFPGAAPLTQVLLVIAVSAVVGVLRFVALRGWVFTPRRQGVDA
ncbi:GtrA family protein [Rhodococcus sp. X156]|uniref:GtrA family protein n=1 Tax=Rhodococcus sp. X156 TaxID=2499145 RepID=UPI000FD9090D|nr:GtrA family protein [Rhodococcus sp. X156]